MNLRIFNTLNMHKEAFTPLEKGKVKMYVCGVTVYDYCHVGHARSAIVFDTIYRYLKHRELDVTYVRNFTDIDDKIINRANDKKVDWNDITTEFIDAFYEDMDRLNIARPEIEPKATENIQQMLDLIASLIEQDKAYESEGDVYYAVRSFPEYGKLSGRDLDDLLSGARVEIGEKKRDPLDFALWKKSKPGEPYWDSPWGEGRPGWHIECSAMSKRFLGDVFDIHGGGKDLVFPHHENEIAQSQGCTGHPPVKYWVHNGFVNINKEKMSKSLGNFFTIRDILKKYHPEVLRLFLLTSHYRSPIDFADQYLEEAGKVLDRFYEFLGWLETAWKKSDRQKDSDEGDLIKNFNDAMDDDFNTAVVMAHLNEALKNLNKEKVEQGDSPSPRFFRDAFELKHCGQVLGLFHRPPGDYEKETLALKQEDRGVNVEHIESLIEQRTTARAEKNWARADECRDELVALGVVLEDTPDGTKWKLK